MPSTAGGEKQGGPFEGQCRRFVAYGCGMFPVHPGKRRCCRGRRILLDVPEGSPPKLPIGGYERSAHAALACSSCHPGSDETPHAEKLPRVDCGNCHADAVLGLKSSTHGKSMLKRVRRRQ